MRFVMYFLRSERRRCRSYNDRVTTLDVSTSMQPVNVTYNGQHYTSPRQVRAQVIDICLNRLSIRGGGSLDRMQWHYMERDSILHENHLSFFSNDRVWKHFPLDFSTAIDTFLSRFCNRTCDRRQLFLVYLLKIVSLVQFPRGNLCTTLDAK